MSCPIFNNHAVRKDGSCSRAHLCATGQWLSCKDGIPEYWPDLTLHPLCKVTNIIGGDKMGGKKKAVKRESAANAAIKEVKAETAAIIGKQEPKFSDDQLIDALKAVGHSATSREVSDKLDIKNADYGRQMVRARMVELIKAGKVAVDEPEKGRAKKLYKVA